MGFTASISFVNTHQEATLSSPMNRRVPLVCIALLLLSPALCSAQGSATPTPTPRKWLSPEKWKSKLEPGDIVFIRSRSDNALLIAALSGVVNAEDDTDDVFTHCGIIFKVGEELKVYEGAGRGKLLTLADWQIAESDGTVGKIVHGKVVRVAKKEPLHNVYAMRWKGQPALATGLSKVLSTAHALHDKRYDNGFYWSDAAAYCSELVWRAYQEGGFVLGDLPTMGKYVTAAPTPVAVEIKKKLNAAAEDYREGKGYLAEESAISPEDIYKSPHLNPITD
jgi:hypothetical protein